MLVKFLSSFYIPPCVGKALMFMEFTFLENSLIRDIFTHGPPHSKLTPCFWHHTLGRRKLLIPPASIIWKICFPQQQKGAEETMICMIKIKSENMKIFGTLGFLFFVWFAIFSNVMDLQFCKLCLSYSIVLISVRKYEDNLKR